MTKKAQFYYFLQRQKAKRAIRNKDEFNRCFNFDHYVICGMNSQELEEYRNWLLIQKQKIHSITLADKG